MKNQSTLEKMCSDLVTHLSQADANSLPSRDSLILLLEGVLDAVEKKRIYHLDQITTIDDKIAGIRSVVNGNRSAKRGRGKNGKLIDYVRNAIKSAQHGITKLDVAKAVIRAGFVTPSTLVDFANSCYVSGIHKLMAENEVESFRKDGDRESYYRIIAKKVR